MKTAEGPRLCSIVGETVVDLKPLGMSGLLPGAKDGHLDLEAIRAALFELFQESSARLRDDQALRDSALYSLSEVEMARPVAQIGQYVDFYSGIHHATNVGKMFRPDSPPLLPNYRWLPVAYNGRASSVVASGTPVRRPWGQFKGANDEEPGFAPTRELDFELEVGFFVGHGTGLGETVPIERADDYVRGFVLVNDWSARDVQRWEYQPLGPFLAKSFATSVSPWIVTLGALEPFRVAGMEQKPAVLPHLRDAGKAHFDVRLEVWLKSAKMKAAQRISATNMRELYWSYRQQLAHLCSNGTPIEAGDLCASGTISGCSKGSYGSMLELTWKGMEPLMLEETGEQRSFLEDGDSVTMAGYGEIDGMRIGFGEVSGAIMPARK